MSSCLLVDGCFRRPYSTSKRDSLKVLQGSSTPNRELLKSDEGFALVHELKEEGNAETHRILALAYLTRGEQDQAQLAIQKAAELQPMWIAIRYASALIDYYTALSPAAMPARLNAWPHPVDWTLIKRDDISQQRLCSAVSTFAELAEAAEEEPMEQERLKIWQLAALANSPYHQETAIQLCCELLENNPANHAAISWGVARNWDIDLRVSRTVLEQKIQATEFDAALALALVYCYFRLERLADIPKLLHRTKDAFEAAGEMSVWQLMFVRSLVADGRLEDAAAIVDSLDGKTRTDAEILLLGARAEQNGTWNTLSDYCKDNFDKNGEPQLLLSYCEVEARQGNWDNVANVVDQLLEIVATGDAARLAVYALFNTRQFEKCSNLIDAHADRFGGTRLPLEIRQMRMGCLKGLGAISEALAEAERLMQEVPSVENLSNLLQICVELGDITRVALYARQLLGKENPPPQLMIGVIRLLSIEKRNLSLNLLQQLIKQGVPDKLTGPTLMLAIELGIEYSELLQRLRQRVTDLGPENSGGMYEIKGSEFATIIKEREQQIEFLNELYVNAKVPIHLLAKQMGLPLVYLYHSQLVQNSRTPNPLLQPALMARHGGKAEVRFSSDDISNWRVHLDITSILLTAHLGLLDYIESEFNPLHIPASTNTALLDMEMTLQHRQPHRVEATQAILQHIDNQSISVFDAQTSSTGWAKQTNG